MKKIFLNFAVVPILVYHSFGPVPLKKENAMQLHYRVTAPVFEAQMKYLTDNKYNPISFSEYVNSLKNKVKLKDKSVVLTFDDGWESQYKYAVPILEKYKFPATFFIITNYTTRPYMSWDELKDLVKNGFDIGSHTENHPPLTKRKEDQLKNEILGSKKALEDKLGITVTTLAYPYYLENKNVRDVVQKSGYLGARAGWAKYKNSLDVIYELKSQEVVNNPNPFLEKRLPDLP